MTRTTLSLLTVSAVIFAATAAHAEQYSLDKPHTQVMFSINHLGFTDSYGRFLDYDGGFNFDRVHPEKSTVDVTVKTGSLDMGDKKWDEHLESKDFFNAAQFPEMTFKSTGVTVTGAKTADVTGNLTILGVSKPEVLHVTYNNSGVNPVDNKKFVAGFSADAMIKRSDFGMKAYLPMVGDDVKIHLEVQGNQVGYQGPDQGKQ